MNAHGPRQQAVLAAIGEACKRANVPPLDRGLRSIVAQQVRNLLVGGWRFDEIRHEAVELALVYDRWNGHKTMTSLQARLERSDEERSGREHITRLALGRTEGMDPRTIEALGLRRAVLPSGHDFTPSAAANTCRICSGPLGVHVQHRGPA